MSLVTCWRFIIVSASDNLDGVTNCRFFVDNPTLVWLGRMVGSLTAVDERHDIWLGVDVWSLSHWLGEVGWY